MLRYYRNNITNLPVLKWHRRSPKDNVRISTNIDVEQVTSHDIIIHQVIKSSTMTVDFVSVDIKKMDGQEVNWVIIAYPTLIPRRTHKKRRIAKKWMQRYGFVVPLLRDTPIVVDAYDDVLELTADGEWFVADRHLAISGDTYQDARNLDLTCTKEE